MTECQCPAGSIVDIAYDFYEYSTGVVLLLSQDLPMSVVDELLQESKREEAHLAEEQDIYPTEEESTLNLYILLQRRGYGTLVHINRILKGTDTDTSNSPANNNFDPLQFPYVFDPEAPTISEFKSFIEKKIAQDPEYADKLDSACLSTTFWEVAMLIVGEG